MVRDNKHKKSRGNVLAAFFMLMFLRTEAGVLGSKFCDVPDFSEHFISFCLKTEISL